MNNSPSEQTINDDQLNLQLNDLAECYVKLSLRVGQHSEYFVDAYYGPDSWRPNDVIDPLSLIEERCCVLRDSLETLSVSVLSGLFQRHQFLTVQTKALLFFIEQLQGKTSSYKEECQRLYDANVPSYSAVHFDAILQQLEQLVPGKGELNQRIAEYRQQFVVPPEKLSQVFDVAINEARERTLKHVALPECESFDVQLTNNQVWSAYNWYKGNSYSLIELNTDHPIFIERVIDLAAHEGYPGHHVFNALIEKHLVNERGWLEYSIYNLYSPVSLLAEGSANYGIEVAFPWKERLVFEQEVLFPLAGLEPASAEQYYDIQRILHQLSYADNLIAQQWIDGEIDDEKAIKLLMKYALNSEDRAGQRLNFIKHNKAYVMTYNYGQDLVKAYLKEQVKDDSNDALWRAFKALLATPKTASMMVSASFS
ncbi:MAG: hypothetical protein ACPGSN_04485 [Psychrobium sp.]